KLWQSDTAFDHHGEFFDVIGGAAAPRPIQTPRPPIMNAGGSPRGMRFAAEHADMCFVIVQSDDPAKIRAQVDEYKLLAKREFNRDVQVWSSAYVVQRETDEEAQAYLQHYSVDCEDTAAVDAWIKILSVESKLMAPEALRAARQRFAAGAGGFPLVGTPERIVSRLQMLSESGIDGVVLTWVDFVDGLARFIRDCLPLLEQAGLREKFGRGSKAAA
ncbi:MAG TPA: LLM class flavin-dependent oxidoreductase, partial [Sphingobium sp.]|uniref:LLM class flavin-dependent oxidoreductase n=1 Tax=Sphingobium sp. TaxID=1912891 RepID=UPI002ED59C05